MSVKNMKYTNGAKVDSTSTLNVIGTNRCRRPGSPNQFGGGPLHSVIIQYLSTKGKKIFIILCAFIFGTLIGSSFPYYSLESTTKCSSSAKVLLNPITRATPLLINHQNELTNVGNASQEFRRKSEWSLNEVQGNYSDGHLSGTSFYTIAEEANVESNTSLDHWTAVETEKEITTSIFVRKNYTVQSRLKYENTPNSKYTVDQLQPEVRKSTKYVVNTPECKIPKFDPWDKTVRHAIKRLEPLDCGSRPLTYIDGDVLHVNESNVEYYGINDDEQIHCCYSELVFSQSKVEPIISANCTLFTKKARLLKEEFIRVMCYSANQTNIYTDFLYTVPLKPEVESRCERIAAQYSHDRGKQQQSQKRYSIMILGIDATSRLNFERHLPRTRDFILRVLKGVEMLGYNKVGDNTFPNLVAMLMGATVDDLKAGCWSGGDNAPLDDCPWLWKHFEALGYRTMYGEDSPTIDTFHYIKKGFTVPPTDYFMRPLLLEAEKGIGNRKDGNVFLCLGQRPQYQVSTSWAFHLMERFRSNPYFGLVWSNSLTHDFPNYVQHADAFLHQSLQDLHTGRHLSNTFLFVVSDHGARWGALRETPIGRYEEHLPALYVIPPRSFRKSKPGKFGTLLENARRLTTTFDLHVTLKAIGAMSLLTEDDNRKVLSSEGIEGSTPLETSRGLSWFSPIPWKRTCSQASVDPHWCACDESVVVNTSEPVVLSAAALVVRHINNKTDYVRERCTVLTTQRVVSALRETNVQTRERDHEIEFIYHVVVLVQPGAGMFEGTIRSNINGTFQQVQGPVSRLSLYGNQSLCVNDRETKTFCFCSTDISEFKNNKQASNNTLNIDPR